MGKYSINDFAFSETQLASAVDKQNVQPNCQTYASDSIDLHEIEALFPLHGDPFDRSFMKQLSCATFPETTGLKRKRDQFAFAL